MTEQDPVIRCEKQKNIDDAWVEVIVFEDHSEAGTLMFSPEGWEVLQKQTLRTKIKCE